MNQSMRFISIKTKLIVFFLLIVLIPILTLFINSYISSQQLLEKKYSDLLIDISRQSNTRIEEFLNDTEKISLVSSYGINSYVSAISQENYPIQNFLHNSSKSNENQAIQLLMNYITMKDQAYSIYIYNFNEGKNLFISSNKPVDYTYSPDKEAWLRDFLASEDITRDIPTHLDLQTKKKDNWVISNVRKIFDMEDGKLLGVMVISIDINFINKLNDQLQKSSRTAYTVVDDKDSVIFSSNVAMIGKPFSEVLPMDQPTSKLSIGEQVVSSGGNDYMLVQTPFEEHDWKTYLYMPVKNLSVEGNGLKRNLYFIVLILIFFALISSYYLSNLITRPIKQLMKNIVLVEKGKFDNLPEVKSNDEVGLLAARFEQMSAELKQLVDRIYQEQEEKAEAEIRALQAQINPHFLYNTLNSLKWIGSMQRSDKIVEMTEALISILRYSTKNDSRLVPIKEELENIRHYITIQKVRYFNKISISYDLDNALLEYLIMKLSIQPIIENAIFHGIADLEEEGCITLSVTSSGEDDIAVIVRDNGKGMDEMRVNELRLQLLGERRNTGGIGIQNVHNRIQRVFGPRYGITLSSELGAGTTFIITIPKRQ